MVPDNSPALSAAELQRQAERRAQHQRDYRQSQLTRWWQSLVVGLRRAFTFTMVAALVGLIVLHRNEIARFVAQKMKQVAQLSHKNTEATPILNGALTHEKEVDEAAGK